MISSIHISLSLLKLFICCSLILSVSVHRLKRNQRSENCRVTPPRGSGETVCDLTIRFWRGRRLGGRSLDRITDQSVFFSFVFQGKRDVKQELPVDTQSGEPDRHNKRSNTIDRDDEANRPAIRNNSDSSTREQASQLLTTDNINTRSRANTYADQQQPKVQFAVANNFFKNVTDNKDIAKLVAQLATCINSTKKV